MAIITLPSGLEYDRLDWHPVASAQVNRMWGNARRVLDLDNGYMAVTVVIEVATETEARALRSLHAKLRGQANTFRLPATECAQVTAGTITLASDAAAGAVSISTTGWASASNLLVEGQWIMIADQLLLLTAGVPSTGTNRTLTFDPPLRAAAVTGAAVEIANPTGLVFIPGGEAPETVNGITTWAFEAEEAF